MAAAKKVAKKVVKRKSKGKKTVVTMSHIHRFCAAAIADGVRFLLRLSRRWPLCLTVRARAQTVRLDDACAPIAQTVCNDLCSILVSAAMPHLQARDSDPAKPRKLGAEDLLAAVVSLQNIVARARRTQPPGAHSVRTRANTSGGRRSATCRRAASWSTRPLAAPSNCAETSATAAPAIGARNRRHRRRAGRRRGRRPGRPQQGRRLRRRGRRRRRA